MLSGPHSPHHFTGPVGAYGPLHFHLYKRSRPEHTQLAAILLFESEPR